MKFLELLSNKAHDQPILVGKLLDKHNFRHKSDENSRFGSSSSSELSRYDLVTSPGAGLPPRSGSRGLLPDVERSKTSHFKRRFNLQNYHSFYRVVKVCHNCYKVYTILTDYFSEIEKLPSRRPRSLSAHRRQTPGAPGVEAADSENQDLKGTLSTKKTFLMKTLGQVQKRRKNIIFAKPPLAEQFEFQ